VTASVHHGAAPIVGLSLSDLSLGVRCRIVGIGGEPGAPGTVHSAIAQRLGDLGFTPGAEIEAVRRAPLGDPMIYRVCGYDICLRRAQAITIRVELIP
jgi:ferrous iron transport protein A